MKRPAMRLSTPRPPASRARTSREPRVALPAAMATVVLALAVPAGAHDLCLLPDAPRVEAGGSFALAMHVADLFPGDPVAWRSGRILEFFMTDVRGRTDVAAPGLEGDPPRARLALRAPGTALVSLVTDASYIELGAEEFEKYLEHDGHVAVREARRRDGLTGKPGRERYTRHVKTILNAKGPSASVALTRTGMVLEIVPETDLAHLAPGGTLPVRVFFRGGAHADAKICATYAGRDAAGEPYAWCGTLDGAGRAAVPIAAAGWQMIRASKMIAVHDDPKADWHSYWTSLTFHVDGPPPAATEAPR
jgi:uncharacterized protein DUF4198